MGWCESTHRYYLALDLSPLYYSHQKPKHFLFARVILHYLKVPSDISSSLFSPKPTRFSGGYTKLNFRCLLGFFFALFCLMLCKQSTKSSFRWEPWFISMMGYEQLGESGELGDSFRLLGNQSLQALPTAQRAKNTRYVIVGVVTLVVGFLCGLNIAAILGLVHMKEGNSVNLYSWDTLFDSEVLSVDIEIASPLSTEEKLQTFQT